MLPISLSVFSTLMEIFIQTIDSTGLYTLHSTFKSEAIPGFRFAALDKVLQV